MWTAFAEILAKGLAIAQTWLARKVKREDQSDGAKMQVADDEKEVISVLEAESKVAIDNAGVDPAVGLHNGKF